MKKYIFSFFFLLILSTISFAQTRITGGENYYENGKGIIYDKEFSVDLKILQTNGYALGVNWGNIKTYYLTRFYNIEFGEIKNPREYRQRFEAYLGSSFNDISRPFIYGKQNKFFVLRAGMGEKRLLSDRARRKGLAIGVSYELGPSLGLLKPYYLEFIVDTDEIRRKISKKYTPENESQFLDVTGIYGGAGFSKGLSELSVVPGGHLKAALHFDWGAFDEFVKAIELGFVVDFYFKKIPIMVESSKLEGVRNSPVFINLYLNLQIGKRK